MIDWKPVKLKLKYWALGVLIGWVTAATMGWARQIDLTKAGVSLWIFLAVAFCIIMLQLVPALVVFAAFMWGLRHPKKEE